MVEVSTVSMSAGIADHILAADLANQRHQTSSSQTWVVVVVVSYFRPRPWMLIVSLLPGERISVASTP